MKTIKYTHLKLDISSADDFYFMIALGDGITVPAYTIDLDALLFLDNQMYVDHYYTTEVEQTPAILIYQPNGNTT